MSGNNERDNVINTVVLPYEIDSKGSRMALVLGDEVIRVRPETIRIEGSEGRTKINLPSPKPRGWY